MHDDTLPTRIYQMSIALKSGQFPVRWVGDLGYGYGYPIFNFYAPLPYYIGAILNLMGINALLSTKLTILIALISSLYFMYLLGKSLINNYAGLFAGVLYLYTPYHAVNTYVRGALGELYAYAFLPVILYGIINIIKYTGILHKDKKNKKYNYFIIKYFLISTIFTSFLFLSHNIIALIYIIFFALLSIIFLFVQLSKKKLQIPYLLINFSFIIAFGLSSFFIIPSYFEKDYTNIHTLINDKNDYKIHFVAMRQLWDSPWGYAGSAEGEDDGMSFKIGKINLIFLVTAVISYLFIEYKKEKNTLRKSIFWISIVYLSLSIFMVLKSSKLIWELLPILKYIQFPWRFLNFINLFLTIISVYIFINKRNKYLIIAIGILLTIFFHAKYFNPQTINNRTEDDYIDISLVNHKISKISDEYMPKGFNMILYENIYNQIPDYNLEVEKFENKLLLKRYKVNLDHQINFYPKIANFPGWTATIDGEKIDIDDYYGIIELKLPAGNYNLELFFKNTPIRTISNTISILSIFLLLYVSSKIKDII
jgi:hypothetical protein